MYSGDKQNHKASHENTKDTTQKKIPKVLLRICVFVFEPKKSQPWYLSENSDLLDKDSRTFPPAQIPWERCVTLQSELGYLLFQHLHV